MSKTQKIIIFQLKNVILNWCAIWRCGLKNHALSTASPLQIVQAFDVEVHIVKYKFILKPIEL